LELSLSLLSERFKYWSVIKLILRIVSHDFVFNRNFIL
jgi:hypothetical protein